MSIDIEQHLKQLAKDWDLSEKEIMTWWRGAVRRMFAKSPPMLKFVQDNTIVVVNDNPRSKKRFPKVKKFKCAMDDKLYGSNFVEVDHIVGENACAKFSDAESFLTNIVFIAPTDLQILSKDNHKIKTYAERHGYSFNEARVRKEVIALEKSGKLKQTLVDIIQQQGYNLEIPKTKPKQKEMLIMLMLNEIEKGDSVDE